MYYEINVSKDGKHLFATAKRSINTEARLKEVYTVFDQKFLASEGYNLTVTFDHQVHEIIDMDKFFPKTKTKKADVVDAEDTTEEETIADNESEDTPKLIAKAVEEQNSKELDKNEPIFYFATETQRELWLKELTGQISDGMWENTPRTNWEFWCSIQTAISKKGKTYIKGEKPYKPTKYNFNFSSVIQYVGDDMMEIGKKYNQKYTYRNLRNDLVTIKKAMKEFGSK